MWLSRLSWCWTQTAGGCDQRDGPWDCVLTLSDSMSFRNDGWTHLLGRWWSLVVLAEGELTLTVNSTMGDAVDGQLTIPELAGSLLVLPWTACTWTAGMLEGGSFVVTEDLSGWSIEPENTECSGHQCCAGACLTCL